MTSTSYRIRKIDVNGNVTTLADVPFFIMGIKIGKMGNIFVSGEDNIAKYSPAGVMLWRLKSHGSGNVNGDTSIVQFNLFGAVEVDSTENNIYFPCSYNVTNFPSQLKKLDIVNKTMTVIAGDGTSGDVSTGPALSCKFNRITCLVLDKTGGLYFGGFNHKICYLKNGMVTTIIDGPFGDVDGDVSVARIKTPFGLALDSQGNLFISCTGNNKIKKLVID